MVEKYDSFLLLIRFWKFMFVKFVAEWEDGVDGKEDGTGGMTLDIGRLFMFVVVTIDLQAATTQQYKQQQYEQQQKQQNIIY